MVPTLVLKDNKPFMVVGTPGGTTIPTSVYQSIVDVIDFGMSAVDAVDKPKFHHQWLPDVVFAEPYALSADTLQVLRAIPRLEFAERCRHIGEIFVNLG